jgi:hypothetical protein
MRTASAPPRRTRVGVALAALIVAATPALATEEVYLEVAQPMCEGNGGCHVLRVTYVTNRGSAFPGDEIAWTCAANAVVVDRGFTPSPGTPKQVENRNAAYEAGFTIRVTAPDQERWTFVADAAGPVTRNQDGTGARGYWYADTTDVVLDVSKGARASVGDSMDDLVKTTVRCILDNASRSVPPIRYVRLVITGSDRFRDLQRVHAIPNRR